MKALFTALLFIAQVISVSALTLNSSYAADSNLAIPYTKYVLDNGLTLIVHEDKKAPIVAVNVWYHVGSKDEKEGRTGFAHLFEHLMFNGSENYNDDWFKPFARVGATGMNGTTNQDRTNYFEVVPKNALEMALWMESDRMGHLLGAIDQAKLDEQRAVVKNEKRQGENKPYGRVFSTIIENVYPKGHPYSWSVIGSMEHLDAASLDDVHDWFKSKYGAANATLVLSGDIEAEQAKALVEKYFGDIASGPPLTKQSAWVAKRTGKHTQTMYDRVPQAQTYKVWNIPEWGNPDADYLELASAVLSADKKSRLYNRLVYKERVASDISAFSFNSELGGLFGIAATAIDPEKLSYIEQAIDEELQKFLKEGPSKDELRRIKTGIKAGFINGLESVIDKADLLAQDQVFTGDPTNSLTRLARTESATAKQILNASQKWLSDGEYMLRVLPFADYTTKESSIDRSKGIPKTGPAPIVSFDVPQKTTLDNGLKVVLAPRSAIPVVEMRLVIDAGYAADFNNKAGTASLTMSMLDEGTSNMDALEISSELAKLGSSIGSSAGLDTLSISLNSLKENLEKTLSIYSDIILNPSFSESELNRQKEQQLTSISQAKSSAFGLGLRVLPGLLYGKDNAYSSPLSGSGDELSVASITSQDLKDYHQTWFKANNATLIVTGDISMDDLKPLLEKAFNDMPNGDFPKKKIANVGELEKSTIYIIDRPDSIQSAILAAKLVPEYGFDKELQLKLLNKVLGADFNARINMNLREDKGWSYGARSTIIDTQAQRPLLISTSVQSDKTAESINEIYKELKNIVGAKPASADELARSLDTETLTLPGRWETASAVNHDLAKMVTFKLADNYWDNYVKQLRKVSLEEVNQVAKEYISSDKMVWLIVGERAQIEQKIRDLKLAEVIVLDQDGNPVE